LLPYFYVSPLRSLKFLLNDFVYFLIFAGLVQTTTDCLLVSDDYRMTIKATQYQRPQNNFLFFELGNLKVTYICVTQKLPIMNKAIQQNWFLPHAPETVWQFLTDSEMISQWLMPNDFKAEVGHCFQFHTKARPGFDGTVYCEVLELVPQQRLSYSWKGGPAKGKISLDSVVTWTLVPKNNGTELQLNHSGFKSKNFLAYFFMSKGWASKIRKRFETMPQQPV